MGRKVQRGGSIQSVNVLPSPEMYLVEHDSTLARIITQQPQRWPILPTEDPIWGLLRIVMAQQVSTIVACGIAERVRLLYPHITLGDVGPAPSIEALRGLGLPASRAKCCAEILSRSTSIVGEVNGGATWETALAGIKGIGPWTIATFRVMVLRHVDVLPLRDIGLERAIAKSYGPDVKVEVLGDLWRPYRSVACWYLWRTLGNMQLG